MTPIRVPPATMRPLAATAVAVALLALAGPALAQDPLRTEHLVYLHETSIGLHVLPEVINAKVGETLVLQVTNQGSSPHNLRVCGDDPPLIGSECAQSWGQTKFNVAPNETVTLTVESLPKAGTFQYYCYVPGHKSGGMVGTLQVQGDAADGKNGVPAAPALAALVALGAVALARRRAP